MRVYSIGNYYEEVTCSPPNLKLLLQHETGKNFRRVSRFIQLALIGAARCVNSLDISQKTSVYLTSGQGDLDVTIAILEKIYLDLEPPKPLSFINTVSNAACFNVASLLGLQGKSNFVTSHYFAFERNLELAFFDTCSGHSNSALIGSVDICVTPLSQHRERIGINASSRVGEGSHWWLLSNENIDAKCIANIHLVKNFNHKTCLEHWLSKLDTNEYWYIAGGQYLEESLLVEFMQIANIHQHFDYCKNLAFYNTQSGSVLYHFIQQGYQGRLLHINTDTDGRYCVFILDVD